jgi:GNAT superfamily N-acetyltransferase
VIEEVGAADIDEWVDVGNRVNPERARTVEQIRASMERFPLQQRLAARRGERTVGVAFVVPDTLKTDGSMYGDVRVLADAREMGVGAALYEAVVEWARAQGGTAFQVDVFESDVSTVRFWTHRGYEVVEREITIALDVESCELPRSKSSAFHITTLAERPDLLEAVYAVGAGSWGDVPAHTDQRIISFDEWHAYVTKNPMVSFDRMFIAIADGQAVGYAELQTMPLLPDIASHGYTGVLRDWRGRGVATALKRAQIRWAQDHGMRQLRTKNHEDNAPMRMLNERLGYRYLRTEFLLRGSL